MPKVIRSVVLFGLSSVILFQHVVFGSVVEGMDVVKKIESLGSQSGKTSLPVKIAASGQL